jgi:hypothetical protein
VINYITFPHRNDLVEKHRDPDWFRRNKVKQFPIPSTIDLGELRQMNLDEPSGILGLTMKDGRLWLMYYDGYDDGEHLQLISLLYK